MKSTLVGLCALCSIVLGCSSKVSWTDTVPSTICRKWTETSDDIVAGDTKPDIIQITSNTVATAYWIDDENEYRRSLLPVIRCGNWDGSRFVIFCGQPDPDHISKTRLEVLPEQDGRFIRVYEIIPTGRNDEDKGFLLGRFVSRLGAAKLP